MESKERSVLSQRQNRRRSCWNLKPDNSIRNPHVFYIAKPIHETPAQRQPGISKGEFNFGCLLIIVESDNYPGIRGCARINALMLSRDEVDQVPAPQRLEFGSQPAE